MTGMIDVLATNRSKWKYLGKTNNIAELQKLRSVVLTMKHGPQLSTERPSRLVCSKKMLPEAGPIHLRGSFGIACVFAVQSSDGFKCHQSSLYICCCSLQITGNVGAAESVTRRPLTV